MNDDPALDWADLIDLTDLIPHPRSPLPES